MLKQNRLSDKSQASAIAHAQSGNMTPRAQASQAEQPKLQEGPRPGEPGSHALGSFKAGGPPRRPEHSLHKAS